MLCGISFIVFVIVVLIYVGIMVHDLRTLWSGVSFWGMLACLVLLLFFTVSEYSAQLASSGRFFRNYPFLSFYIIVNIV